MNDQNIIFGYTPMEKLEKSKNVKYSILINVQSFYRPLSTWGI